MRKGKQVETAGDVSKPNQLKQLEAQFIERERALILETLERCDWVLTWTAQELGSCLANLRSALKRHPDLQKKADHRTGKGRPTLGMEKGKQVETVGNQLKQLHVEYKAQFIERERALILETLEKCEWVLTWTAQELGSSLSSLCSAFKRHPDLKVEVSHLTLKGRPTLDMGKGRQVETAGDVSKPNQLKQLRVEYKAQFIERERVLILETLERCEWVKSWAAQELGSSLSSLCSALKRHPVLKVESDHRTGKGRPPERIRRMR